MVMKIINIKILSYILVFLIIATLVINYHLNNQIISFAFLIDSITKSVTVISLFFWIFSTCLWKMKILQGWLVLVPNLNGIWKGKIHSDWIDSTTSQKVPAIDTTLIIKQSLFNISCIMKTGEMTSRSISFGYILDKENQLKQLSYTYMSVPLQTIQERSRIHYGTMLFDIGTNTMSGSYWTGRKTSGNITVTLENKTKTNKANSY